MLRFVYVTVCNRNILLGDWLLDISKNKTSDNLKRR